MKRSRRGIGSPWRWVGLVSQLAFAAEARADGVLPESVELPTQLSLDQSVQILWTKSLDVLIAEAACALGRGRRGGRERSVINPAINAGYGRVLSYSPSASGGESADQYTLGLSDSAAIEDSLSGKRDLRLRVARRALEAARLSRADALRTIEFQVKSAYAQVARRRSAPSRSPGRTRRPT